MFAFQRAAALVLFVLLAAPAVSGADKDSSNESAPNLSPLAREPDWSVLEKYQETITHDEFEQLLTKVYGTRGVSPELIDVDSDAACVLTTKGANNFFILRFAKTDADRLPLDRSWRMPNELPPLGTAGLLAGFHIALDPGHLGGKWARMEERWFRIGHEPPVREGNLTRQVARILARRLQSLGAKVSLVRNKTGPMTRHRPDDFEEIALQLLHRAGISQPRKTFDGPADPHKEETVRWQEELLFYRNAEIRRRSNYVNHRLRPDLVLCLHFNAEPWGDPSEPTLVPDNHLHLLVNGAYLPAELELDDVRFEMLQKLLSGAFPEEVALADALAQSMAAKTGLPPYHYTTENVAPVGTSGYVYARNLMATRLYRCPTVYLEPYVMNNREVFARVQAGDYRGVRTIAGVKRPSIYREYADGVADGLLEYFKKERPAN